MNKIPRKYKPKLSLQKTQEALFFFTNQLKNEIIENFEITEIRAPLFTSLFQSSKWYSLMSKRTVAFDTTSDEKIYSLINNFDYWLHNSLVKLEKLNNQGVFSQLRYIDRDNDISNFSSKEKNILSLELRFDNSEMLDKKIENLMQIIYSLISKTFIKMKQNFRDLDSSIPKKLVYEEFEFEKYNFVEEKYRFFLKERAIKHQFFAIWERSDVLNLFDSFNNKNRINVYGYLNNNFVNIITTNIRNKLSDIEKEQKFSDYYKEESNFMKEYLLGFEIQTINISIDIDILLTILLENNHILELQSGRKNKEIRNLFIANDIKDI